MQVFIPVVFLAAIAVGGGLASKFTGPTALPVVLHNGYLADTHEVAAAKNAHLATLSQQSHGGSYGQQEVNHNNQHGHHGDLRYHGPIAVPHVLHDGHIADTHEVTAAKAEHYAAVAKARAHGSDYSGQYASGYSGASGAHQGYGTHVSYHGPIAIPHVLHDGHIADTHEVTAAKAEHYAAVAKARAHAGYSHGGDYNGQYDHFSGASGALHGFGTHSSYNGPLAKPVLLPNGYLADTVEVSNAKHQHLQLVHSSHSKHLY